MNNPNPKDLLTFPKMVASLVWQLIFYTLTEPETFLLAVACILVGLQFGVLLGLMVYFFCYWGIRMMGGYVALIASKLHLIGRVISDTTKGENE